jgi:hypothetical protein
MKDRGQLVLLAAAALAIALAPMALAHLQLGYDEDVESHTIERPPLGDTERVLHRAVDAARADVPSQYDWADRSDAITAVRDRLRPTLTSLNQSRLQKGTVTAVSYDHQRAAELAASDCPGGPHREFGPCIADSGVVVQERRGETHVIAVAFDIESTTARGEWRTSAVVSPGTRGP